ncbi:diacylglycerol acyltransferase-domain-containing protein [Baffinella frigidus]|nr:diacylglycerol acyltransferase-domain-containing protein [Cryptophyta sp. CCMP2293]
MSANFAAEHDPDIEVTHVKLADGSPASVFRTKVWDTWPLTRTAIVLVSGSTMLFLTGPLLGATAWYALPRWLAAPLLLGYAAWVATSKSHKDGSVVDTKVYAAWVATSKSHKDGSVVDTAYRTSTVHLATLEYFKARLVMEDSLELRESRPLVIGQHPHGVYGYHGIFFMASSKKNFFYRKFPHLANKICLAVADVLFYVPFVREILLYVGHVVVSRSTLEKMLAMGRSVGIECLLAENGTDKVVLGGRKGFVKLALRYGKP